MEECHCSNIVIMQLFHELKQQFPALPDYIVSQCIAQNSHDRDICTRSLRAAQNLRVSPGAFPPPAPEPLQLRYDINNEKNAEPKIIENSTSIPPRAHRPNSLNIDKRQSVNPNYSGATSRSLCTSASAPTYSPRDLTKASPSPRVASNIITSNIEPRTSGFQLNVNVACSPASPLDFDPRSSSRLERLDLTDNCQPPYGDSRLGSSNENVTADHTRGYTSVSLILRPPSSAPQPPIDIRSQGSSVTYSTSSSDPRGFQSRLLISIGPGQAGGAAAARIKSQMGHSRPQSFISGMQSTFSQSAPGVAGPSGQNSKPMTMRSANAGSLDIDVNIPACKTTDGSSTAVMAPHQPSRSISNDTAAVLNQVAEHKKGLVTEQLKRKERLAYELRLEKTRLETMRKDIKILLRPVDPAIPAEELKKKLRSEIYQLQVECDRLADEVDQRSDPRVPFGETNEEFYQGIYTGQSVDMPAFTRARPPLPTVPPAWESPNSRINSPSVSNYDVNERDGPSWICRMCTFDNHPLMDKCEQCDMPKFQVHNSGTAGVLPVIATQSHTSTPDHN